MPLVDQPFADTFTFSRGCRARYRDATGQSLVASLDQPRLDHNGSGEPLGLLVEGFGMTVAADRLEAIAGDWTAQHGTVLHELLDETGQLQRRALYAPRHPRAALNACLNMVGWHRRIAYVPIYLKNRGGFVRWRNAHWTLGGALAAEEGVLLAATDSVPILEG